MTPQAQTISPPEAMMQMLNGLWVAGAVSCLARLGIPDLVESGPKTSDELAREIGADPDALYRLMRATASVGVLAEVGERTFAQTLLSSVLRSDSQPSLRGWAILQLQEFHVRGWEHLEYCVRTGKQALNDIYGMPAFDYLFSNPERSEIFNRAMTDLSMLDSPAIADACPLEDAGSIVDVAGGQGLLLATILARNPRLRGTLCEAPQVIEGAKTGPLKPFADRCTFIAGDMFTSVPAGSDVYMMKHIIHDWPDDQCIKILRGCREGVNSGGKLLVVDQVIRPGNDFDVGKFMDLEMLIFPGGHERTEPQFRDLFAASGWRLNRVIPTQAGISIVEGTPV